MPSDLSSYLATRYLTADPKPSSTKKRKKKQQGAGAGLIIADEDEEAGWRRAHARNDEDDEGPATVAGTSAEFRKTKKSAWKTVGAPVPAAAASTQGGGGDDAAADAILRSAAQESAAAGGGDGPDGDDDAAAVVTMSDGTHAGLQTAAAVSAQLERRRRRERDEYERQHPGGAAGEAETVYRDATGRRVDAGMKRAEARREAAAAEAKKAAALEALKGDVQRDEARRRREALEDVRVQGVARRADDADLNAELKAQARWGDTMAEFVGQGGGGGSAAAAAGKKKTKSRPVYPGAAPPNRYGIRPGYRWDGVDRSNGFEMERFKAINRVERNKTLDYNWQMDE